MPLVSLPCLASRCTPTMLPIKWPAAGKSNSPPSTPLPGTINGFTGQTQIERPLIEGSGMGLINS